MANYAKSTKICQSKLQFMNRYSKFSINSEDLSWIPAFAGMTEEETINFNHHSDLGTK